MHQPFTFFWNELNTRDTKAAQEFYAKLFGWEIQEEKMPAGITYTMFKKDGAPVAGAMNMDEIGLPAEIPPHWFPYVSVEDVAATCQLATENGGKVIQEPFDVDGVGTIAILEAADGSRLGIITPVPRDGMISG